MAKKQTTKKDSTPQKTVIKKPAPKANSDLKLEGFMEEIRARAAEIFRHRGHAPGDALSDWLQAEKEIKKKHGIK